MYGFHNHSIHSHDGKNTVFEMCESAIEKGLKGIAFTDHVDLTLFEERNIYNETLGLKQDVLKAKEQFKGKLDVFFGMELGEEYYQPELAKKMRDIGGYDVILGSLHFLPTIGAECDIAYADIPIWSQNRIKEILEEYLNVLLFMAKKTDIDVLAHITYPLRYINCIYKKNFDDKVFYPVYEEILRTLIKRNIALEVNTSNAKSLNVFLPHAEIVKKYFELGGELITVGADAHNINNVDNGLKEGLQLLKDVGFKYYTIFNERKPKMIKL